MKSEPDLEGFKLFLQEEERTPNTIRSYLYAVEAYFKAHPELTKQKVIAWKTELSRSYPASTVNLRLNAIRQYAVFKNILLPVKLMKVQMIFNVENVITDEQYHHLMYCLKADGEMQWYYNILILAKTGTRISEAVRLKKADVMHGYAIMSSKGKVRTVLFPTSLQEDLREYLLRLENQEYLLQSTRCRGQKPIACRAFNHALQRFAERYQIPPEVMHPHSFRHHFGVKVMQKTNDISYVADLMGHSSISTTRRYTQQSVSQQQKKLDSAVDW